VSLVEVFLSVFIAVLAVPGGWLQLNRVRKEGTSEGLSVTYVAVGAISCATWLTYGFLSHEVVQIVVNSSGTVSLLLILGLMIRLDRSLLPISYFVGAYLVAIVVTGLLFGPDVPGVLGTLSGFFCRVPQVYKSWREPGGVAVSVPSFLLSSASGSGWLAFGLIHADVFILVSSASTILTSMYIVARTVRADEQVGVASAVA
jgi:uncharacterized protein with PQ loop repeat